MKFTPPGGTVRTGTGTGLGLAICKHVVQAHGGSLVAESGGPGLRATFRFTLPAAAAEAALPAPQTVNAMAI